VKQTPPIPDASSVTVRPARRDDLARLAELFDQYRMFYAQPSRRQRAEAFLAERIAKQDSLIYVAEHGGRIEGFMQLYPSFSSLSMGPILVFNDLFVDPEARGQGVGAALLETAHKLAEETGAAHMTLATARDNRQAIELYSRMGWQADEAYLHMYLPVKDKSGYQD
jgi:GNAT superfamily N-acetyltransferase